MKQCKILFWIFSNAIAEVLTCPNDYVRVMSLHKSTKKQKQTEISFGITTRDLVETQQFADNLKVDLSMCDLYSLSIVSRFNHEQVFQNIEY